MHNNPSTNDNRERDHQLHRQMSSQSHSSGGGGGGAMCDNARCNRCHPQQPQQKADRKHLRDALYTEIFQRHRRSIFAFASFLRMLKSRKANYNVIKQDPSDLD